MEEQTSGMDFNSTTLERLLNTTEGTTLDFKREQYRFNGFDDTAKSELLKDILAFTNSSRDEVAYILIGVEEAKVGRSKVIGISEHLDDANLHQFVNSKTNRPVKFSYFSFAIEDKFIGVLEIPIQEGPVYTRNDFGKLKANAVYIRDGSSTRMASPDEILTMGRGTVPRRAINGLRGLARNSIISVVEQWRRHPYRHSEYGPQYLRPTYEESREFILGRSRLDYESGIDSYGSLYHIFRNFENLAARCGQMFRRFGPILVDYEALTQAMVDIEDCVKFEQSVWREFLNRTNDPRSPLPTEATYNLLAIASVAVHLLDILDSGSLREDLASERAAPVFRRSKEWGEWTRP